MCAILAILDTPESGSAARSHADRAELLLDRLSHRGPDERGSLALDHAWLGHRRLAIISPDDGHQPATTPRSAWVTNSEIYNHDALRETLAERPACPCDAAVVGPLIEQHGIDALPMLDAQFAIVCVLTDPAPGQPSWLAARDHAGICPLYLGRHADGSLWFASEMKALIDDCDHVELVEPGTAWIRDEQGVRCVHWRDPDWAQTVPDAPADHEAIRSLFTRAVEKRMASDVPWGVLLSGGLDSSLIASIATRIQRERGLGPIHTFSIGLDGSPDLAHARDVARFLGTHHHEFRFTVEEALEALPSLVEHLESDQQIRTGVPTYLLAKAVRNTGFKMVLSGEGADEILGGYLYFHKAPSTDEFHRETVRKLTRLHQYDVMRANKAPMAHGLELRFPMLDKSFVDLLMSTHPAARMPTPRVRGGRPVEKHLLRAVFDDPNDPWLPDSVLWRQKEQFSDGVGYAWVDAIRDRAAERVSEEQLAAARERFPESPPTNAEMYWMRELFEERFVTNKAPGRSALGTVGSGASVACSTPEALSWDPAWSKLAGDISGRAIEGVHDADESLDNPQDSAQDSESSTRDDQAA